MTEAYYSGFSLCPLLFMAYTVIDMQVTERPASSNNYAVAKALNNEILSIILCLVMADTLGLPEEHEINDLNRAYVLLVNELEDLYSQSAELVAITPEPFWKKFDVLKTSIWDIHNYLSNPGNDMGQAHIARLDKLCIISGIETPELSPSQKEQINYSSKVVSEYTKILENARLDNNQKVEDSWYISDYTLSYKPDGTILVNNVLKLKKTHIDSTIDKLLEQAFKHTNELFVPELGATSRNLSTVLSSAGFTPTLRKLFFPIISKSKGVLFRPVISNVEANKETIDTTALDLILRALDADTTFSE
jgi:hypothetical protein